MCNTKVDARFQKLAVLHRRRKEVITLHGKGVAIMEITRLSGLSYPTVRRIINRYVECGEASIKPIARGKKQGVGRVLTAQQEYASRQLICNNLPGQLAMDFALWDRAAVMALIERESGIRLSARSVDSYTKRWGFSQSRKARQASHIQPWIENEYSIIWQRAKDEKAEIHWITRASFSWTGKPNFRIDESVTASNQLKIISTTNQNKARWMIIKGTLTPSKFALFLIALVQCVEKKVFILIEDLPLLHKKAVISWIRKHKSQVKLVCIPPARPTKTKLSHTP